MGGALQCRRAGPQDTDEVTSLITLAFARDPLWSWAMARPDGDLNHHSRLWRVFVEGALRYPWTWLVSGGQAASLWIPPGGSEMSQEQEERLAVVAREVLGSGSDGYFELFDRFAAMHPKSEPHYYLSLLGTHPAHRGHGVGMALLDHDLGQIDAEGMPAYLESSNPANNARYESVGFETIGEFSAPHDGPVVTMMWRPAR
jgi:ribosomal protein S18 acetylase RimI-like enzyme